MTSSLRTGAPPYALQSANWLINAECLGAASNGKVVGIVTNQDLTIRSVGLSSAPT